MPVHSVILISSTGNVVYSKYFSPLKASDKAVNLLFEQMLYRHTSKVWTNKTVLQLPQTITIEDVHVVFQKSGELILFVAGTDDIDEVVCEFAHFNSPCHCN
jgi:hypothetical protein